MASSKWAYVREDSQDNVKMQILKKVTGNDAVQNIYKQIIIDIIFSNPSDGLRFSSVIRLQSYDALWYRY